MTRDRSLLVLPVAFLALVVSLVAGAFRLMGGQGLAVSPGPWTAALPHHGEMMIFAFLGPVIMMERYSATRFLPLHPVVRALPVTVGAGSLLFTLSRLTARGTSAIVGIALLLAASVIYVYLLSVLTRYTAQPGVMHIMALAGVALFASLLVTRFVPPVHNMGLALLMLAFPVLTVLGERVELGSILNPDLARHNPWITPLLGAGIPLFLTAGLTRHAQVAAWSLVAGAVTWIIVGAVLAWGERHLWRREADALYRYLSRSMMIAYGWLLAGGVMVVAYPFSRQPSLYDAATHAIALGFVLGMILAHAPVIVPALLAREAWWTHLPLWPLALHTVGTVARVGGMLWHTQGTALWVHRVVGLSWVPIVLGIAVLGTMLARGLREGEADDADEVEAKITIG